jgi:hypothetical protein
MKLKIMKTVPFVVLMLACASASAQTAMPERKAVGREEMHIRYRVAKAYLDKGYMNNEPVLDRIVEWAEEVQKDSMVNILSVEFCGAVSPEGSVAFNHWLSVARLTTLEKYVRKRVDIPEEIITRSDHYIAWDELRAMVLESDLPNKDAVIEIIDSENTSVGNQLDSRIGALKAMDGGKTWRIIFNRYFIHMRNAYMVIVMERSEKFYEEMNKRKVAPLVARATGIESPLALENLTNPIPAVVPMLFDTRYMYVKTNLVGLGMLMANVGVEFDLGRYLSFNLPVYYSAVNYFTPTVKFRTFATQPELRVWPMTNEDGLFIGAHAGFAYYNFAFGGDWRYQDHDGTSPTLGGGLTLGYRMPISKNKNWKLEFGVGAGVYPLYYDVFHNTPNVLEGQLYETRNGTYFGLDNVQVSISYRIPMKKTVL